MRGTRHNESANDDMPIAQRETGAGRPSCVVVLDGRTNAPSVALRERALIVGRDPDCDLRVFAYGVSRRHCAIWRDAAGTCWLLDLASLNGTLVDGRPMLFGVILPGALIQLGSPAQASLTLRCGEA